MAFGIFLALTFENVFCFSSMYSCRKGIFKYEDYIIATVTVHWLLDRNLDISYVRKSVLRINHTMNLDDFF